MDRREKGMGTIYTKPNGTCVGVVRWTGKDGKRKSKSFSGKTEAEVRRKIREYNKKEKNEDNSQTLLKTYLINWLTNVKKGTIKGSSYDRLESTATIHVIPALGNYKICEIEPEDITGMLTDIKDRGLSYSTVKKAYDCANAVLEYAFNKRDIPVNPVALVDMLHESEFEKKDIRFFTKEEAALIVEECGRLYTTGRPVYPYGDAFIFDLHTGLRMGELLGLQKSDINFENKTVTVRRNAQVVKNRNADGSLSGGRRVVLSSTKTYSGSRVISLNDAALEAAMRLCASHPESEYVVCGTKGTQITHERFERSFYRVLKNCGIQQTGVHSLRHTFASVLFSNGTDIKTVSTLLGHASIKITMDTYVHLISDTGKEAVKSLNESI